jgi:cysteine-rich repeat protein
MQDGVEACDDGNQEQTDACLNNCTAAACGDGHTQAGVEACDDGNQAQTDACLNDCAAASCGDGHVQAGVEGCDDGNRVDGDGCDQNCATEVAGCTNHSRWQRVDCQTGAWVWSMNRAFRSLGAANANRVLAAGCTHGNAPNTCSLDGSGWVSTQTFTMNGCNTNWYHIGGRHTGNCGGHDGDRYRLLVLNADDCYDY